MFIKFERTTYLYYNFFTQKAKFSLSKAVKTKVTTSTNRKSVKQ